LYICHHKETGILTYKFIDIMNHLLFLGNLGTGEIIIIAIIVLLLFGGKKIPELMKGLGKGVRNFKDGVKGLEDDIKINDTDTTDKK
jgi:sec-independent protein translocase protein TatA